MLSVETLARMADTHPTIQTVTVTGEGHPPLFRSPAILDHVAAFAAAVEGAQPPADAVIPREPVEFDLDAPPAGEDHIPVSASGA
jgi:hypothetical protein